MIRSSALARCSSVAAILSQLVIRIFARSDSERSDVAATTKARKRLSVRTASRFEIAFQRMFTHNVAIAITARK